nr:VanZ family protein [Anaerotalea alkaliphila]
MGIYLALLSHLVFFSKSFGRDTVRTRYNLELFKTIGNFIKYREQVRPELFYMNIYGNMAAFMPLGLLLPLVLPKAGRLSGTLFSGLLVSVFIEAVQFICKVGSLDVDDVVLNVLGTLLGWMLYRIGRHIQERF